MGDVKHYLRKMDFPDVVPEALKHMQKLWLQDCTTQQVILMKDLASEFVFFEVDQWGRIRDEKLTPIKELLVLDKISGYFSEPGNMQKTATFLFLFPYGNAVQENRLRILKKIISLAIAIGNVNVLNYVGIWLQLNDCTSLSGISIAKTVYQEHFKVSRPISNIVKCFPKSSPLFCAGLTISLMSMYLNICPPLHLVETIIHWLQTNPEYCFEPLKIKLPNSIQFIAPLTPLPVIMRCVILSPFYKENVCGLENKTIFSELHFALIECMLQASKSPEVSDWEAAPINKVNDIVETLKLLPMHVPDYITTSLERLAHCLEVGLANNCIHHKNDNLGGLFISCCDLPYHQLLKIVLQKWSHEVDHSAESKQIEHKKAMLKK